MTSCVRMLTSSPRTHTPSPGAVEPSIVRKGSRMTMADASVTRPATSNLTVRAPGAVTASRKLPGPLSASVVTATARPPRPPGVSAPKPSGRVASRGGGPTPAAHANQVVNPQSQSRATMRRDYAIDKNHLTPLVWLGFPVRRECAKWDSHFARGGSNPMYRLARLLFALALVSVAAAPVAAQDFRGGIRGTITDATGGVLPGVSVTVANAETKISQTVVTDDRGLFEVLYLNAGTYTVTAELSGFRTAVRQGQQVRVGDVARVDLALVTGGVQERVQAVAETPMLNTTTGISGTTIDSKQIAELPLGDGTAYMLTRLAPGIVDSSDLHFARPADNGNLAGIVANGVQGGNEFTIDGAPNMSNARGVGFSPPSDAISEFKVQTNAFDAQTGHTAGAVVNLALKSGTNSFHLASGYFNRDDNRSSTPLLTTRAGGTKPTREYNRYTGTLSGPVIKSKTFFMASFEHLRDVQPEPTTYTVPTETMRNADFSEFSNQVFDPATVTAAGVRTAFPNNQIPANRINNVAAAYTAFYPLPNRPGTVGNYFSNQLRP